MGVGSVLQHVMANGCRTEPPLFSGAITSSTFLPSQYRFNDRVPELGITTPDLFNVLHLLFQLLFSEVVAQTNCTTATDAMACLRAADATVLETANTNINLGGFFGTFLTVPVIDGDFITQRPTLSLIEAKSTGTPF
ncbi:hypothetical protein B0H19DRAFT_572472 [Mycena capillaripes]|nr:hypothetical protein B0H19DRAFT_572472 [Mycena capillaripes]